MKARHKRFVFVGAAVVAVGIAAVLVLNALQSNIAYFFSPTQVLAKEAPLDRAFRLGGLVEEGSIVRREDGLTVNFMVTDTAKSVTVSYTGILPDLFNEGQGVVTKGKLGGDGIFYAEEVLAKHDEAYMPPEVESAIKAAQKAGTTLANPHDQK
ncbi:MAG: cytochrome c maturation protein CcmE [Proteobacteria bacterium]|nr:MAG: cytochrome c maturation protein CcmE [Pseudomonadota bacterium]QKK11204.1 MAG: cytochrome c maturation protein CcmE [Pseudomonadota bacterium]